MDAASVKRPCRRVTAAAVAALSILSQRAYAAADAPHGNPGMLVNGVPPRLARLPAHTGVL